MNLVILIGNLGKNPELRSAGKTPVVNLSIATNETFSDAQGKAQRKTEWHNVVAFGALATNVAKFLSKGAKVAIQGRLQTRKWEDTEGKQRSGTEVVATEVKFLDARTDESEPIAQVAA